MKKSLKIIFSSLLIILVVVIFTKTKNINLEVLKHTKLTEINKISKILNKLDYGDEYDFKVQDTTLIINYNIESVKYNLLEKNASILFYLIDDLRFINFKNANDNYNFNYDNISLIYNGYKDITLNDINKRYRDKNFYNIYLGNINGNIDIFDRSDLCLNESQQLYRTENYIYFVTCSSIDDIIAIMDNKEYKLIDLLDKEIIRIDNLTNINLNLKKEEINYENSN